VGTVGIGNGVGVAVGSVGVTRGTLGVGTGRGGRVGRAVPDAVGVGEGPDPLGLGPADGVAPGRGYVELAWSRDASRVTSGESGARVCGLSAR
jgi:hypothetical protein